MARTKISAATNSLLDDNGTVLISVAKGEQIHLEITLSWLINLSGYNIHANIVEAVNDGEGTKPTAVKVGGTRKLLTSSNGYIRDIEDGDNKFKLVIPYNLHSGASPQPSPEGSIYFYIDLEVGEPGTGDSSPIGDVATPVSQIWKPIRGLIELMYSPTEDA